PTRATRATGTTRAAPCRTRRSPVTGSPRSSGSCSRTRTRRSGNPYRPWRGPRDPLRSRGLFPCPDGLSSGRRLPFRRLSPGRPCGASRPGQGAARGSPCPDAAGHILLSAGAVSSGAFLSGEHESVRSARSGGHAVRVEFGGRGGRVHREPDRGGRADVQRAVPARVGDGDVRAGLRVGAVPEAPDRLAVGEGEMGGPAVDGERAGVGDRDLALVA